MLDILFVNRLKNEFILLYYNITMFLQIGGD